MREMRGWLAREWVAVVLVVGCTVEVLYWLLGPTLGLAAQLWDRRQSPALERSAVLTFGDEFAGYIDFLRARIPEDALVILPPVSVHDVLGNQGMAQYLLFPRRVANCSPSIPVDACVSKLTGPKTYILAVPGFPPPEAASRVKEYVGYDASLGAYLPRPEGH